MSPSKQTKKDALLAEVLEAGSGKASVSAMGPSKAAPASPRPVGRPTKEPTIPFTLRLRQGSAELLQRLVADLQARAVRGELARSEATIGTVVEEALFLYEQKHGSAAGRSGQSGARRKS